MQTALPCPVAESRLPGSRASGLASCVKRCMSDLLCCVACLYVALLPPTLVTRVASLSPGHAAAAHIDTYYDDDDDDGYSPTEYYTRYTTTARTTAVDLLPLSAASWKRRSRASASAAPALTDEASLIADASGSTDKTTLYPLHTPPDLSPPPPHPHHHAVSARTLVIAGGGAGAAHHRHDVGGEPLRNGEFTCAR